MLSFVLFLLSLSFSSIVNDDEGVLPVDLAAVHVLHFQAGQFSNSRRVQPIPHLNCVSGCHYGFLPSYVQCYNLGWNGVDFSWDCHTDTLPPGFELADTTVSCEGHTGPGDRMVLPNSCGLFFSLVLSPDAPYYDLDNPDHILVDADEFQHGFGFPTADDDPYDQFHHHGEDSHLFHSEELHYIHPDDSLSIIHLADILSLTFSAYSTTRATRTSPAVSQLNCQGVYCHTSPEEITCFNLGWEIGLQNFRWECSGVSFGSGVDDVRMGIGNAEVVCEGIGGRSDLNVVEGSCTLYYEMISI